MATLLPDVAGMEVVDAALFLGSGLDRVRSIAGGRGDAWLCARLHGCMYAGTHGYVRGCMGACMQGRMAVCAVAW
eukprot:358957-Chlamydomonas_euryale.AAC.5